ncbi:hypothetical protein [Pseudoalteromonas sp. S16_S37]|uniref:hypothetical protein n=1 Tax=Pseudoalteromonas sp. S16_S37 TaxID=2720228 RepID=UPI00168130C7|nr:hypothetical protein [Pseudoalteromonas sp. S16_S37]MBD1582773.1 hypothetical protein [Pseudoalteromonas sp. S16_S37]
MNKKIALQKKRLKSLSSKNLALVKAGNGGGSDAGEPPQVQRVPQYPIVESFTG